MKVILTNAEAYNQMKKEVGTNGCTNYVEWKKWIEVQRYFSRKERRFNDTERDDS